MAIHVSANTGPDKFLPFFRAKSRNGTKKLSFNCCNKVRGNRLLLQRHRMNLQHKLFIFILIAMMSFFQACLSKDASKKMIVVFAAGEVFIVRDQKDIPIEIGAILTEKDQIKTLEGTVDLQTKSGSALRVRSYTTVRISQLSNENGETRIDIERGGILASVSRKSGRESFKVVTPTVIASVRGTTFSTELDDGGRPLVRVLDGTIAVSPRIAALDLFSDQQIQANPAMKKLAEVQHQEVLLTERTEGKLNPQVEQQVIQANRLIEQAAPAPGGAPGAAPDAARLQQAGRIAEEIIKKPAVSTQQAQISARDMAEKETLVAVSPDAVQRIVNNPSNRDAIEEMKKEQAARQSAALERIREAASKIELKTDDEIRQYYGSIETIVLRNGDRINGAVIALTGEELVVHSTEGVLRIQKSAIYSQELP